MIGGSVAPGNAMTKHGKKRRLFKRVREGTTTLKKKEISDPNNKKNF
jgi:hypothetical protein